MVMLSGKLRKGGQMFGAKIVIWTGAIIAFFGSTLPASISYALRIRPFPDDEANPFALILGGCLLVGGVVAYFYEKDKNSN
jgi:hypothetical protein